MRQSPTDNSSVYQLIFANAKGYYVAAWSVSFMITLLSCVYPLYCMNLFDRLLPQDGLKGVIILSIMVAWLVIFDFLCRLLRSYLYSKIGDKIMATVLEGSSPILANFIAQGTAAKIIEWPLLLIFLLLIFLLGGYLIIIPIVTMALMFFVGHFVFYGKYFQRHAFIAIGQEINRLIQYLGLLSLIMAGAYALHQGQLTLGAFIAIMLLSFYCGKSLESCLPLLANFCQTKTLLQQQ